MSPLVTIGIPTRNRKASLERALQSALGQSYDDLEVLVSDNASTDGTEELCRGYERKDRRLRFVRQPRNVGPVANWRALLDEAKGTYFMWHADDDRYDPRFVEKMVEHLERDPSLALCFSDFREIDEQGTVRRETRLDHLHPDQPWREARKDFFRYPFQKSTVALYGLYRTSVLRQVGVPRPVIGDLMVGLEMPFLAKIARRGRILALPEFLFYYNNHAIEKASLAHEASGALRLWQKVLVFGAIELRLLATAMVVRAPILDRLSLVGKVIGAALRRAAGKRADS